MSLFRLGITHTHGPGDKKTRDLEAPGSQLVLRLWRADQIVLLVAVLAVLFSVQIGTPVAENIHRMPP